MIIAGILTAVTAPWTAVRLGGPTGILLSWLYAALGGLVVVYALWMRAAKPTANEVYPSIALLAFAYLACDLALVRLGNQIQFNSELWLLLGTGFVVLRTRWLHPIMVATAAGWLWLFSGRMTEPLVQQYGAQIVAGIVFGYLAHTIRVQATRRAARSEWVEQATSAEVDKALRETRTSEQRLRTITEGSPLGIFQTDNTGHIAYANARWMEIAGCDYHDFDRVRKAVHPDDVAQLTTAWRQAMSTGTELHAEFRYQHDDGSVRHCKTRALPLRDGDGKLTGYAGTLEDISGLVTAENDLRRAAAEYKALAENSPDLISRFDRDHNRLYANRTVEAMRGQARKQLIGGKPEAEAMTRLSPQTVAKFLAAMDKAFAEKETQALELEGPSTAGPRFYETRIVPELDERGEVATVLALSRDITERKRSEQALAKSRERFRALLDSAPDAMVIVDHEGKMVLVNGQAERVFGYTRSELLGKSVEMLMPAIYATTHVENRAVYMDDPRQRPMGANMELRARRKDGSDFPVEISLSPIETEEGLLVSAAVRDISARKKAADAERIAFTRLLEIEQLKEMDRFKTGILNTASHELNTPITPLKLQLHLLKAGAFGPLSDEQQKSVTILERNVGRLAALVADILDVARLQSGRLRLRPVDTDLGRLVQEAADAFAEPAHAAGVQLKVHLRGRLHALADTQRISQVLDNLLSNALKFTPKEGQVNLDATVHDGLVEVRVKDTGIGLTSDQMARLFQPFSQVHDPVKVQRPGTGLGLYICKGIVGEHGGNIEVTSEGPGHGTTFAFRLPVKGPPVKAIEAPQASNGIAAA